MSERKPRVIDVSDREKTILGEGSYEQTALCQRDDGVNLTVHLGVIRGGSSHNWHDHEQDEVMYIVQGTGKYLLKDREMAYKAGDFVFMPKQTMHQNVVTSHEDVKIIAIFNPAQF